MSLLENRDPKITFGGRDALVPYTQLTLPTILLV